MNTKLIVPELPSDEYVLAESIVLQRKLSCSDEQANGIIQGLVYGRREYAAKHREAAVIAIEALELYSEGHAFCSRSVAIEALEKIKNKIYEQKGE